MFDKKQFLKEQQIAQEKQISELAEYLSNVIKKNAHIKDLKIYDKPSDEEIKYIMDKFKITDYGRDAKEVANELIKYVYESGLLIQHPRMFSFVQSSVSPYSLTASILSDIYNLNAGGYNLAPGAAIIEEKLIKWMGGLAGYPETCGGLFTSGGSLSNLTGCIAARDNKVDPKDIPLAVAYCSDQAHSSIKKALRLMGLQKEHVVIIETDDDFKIRIDLLEQHIKEDIEKGLKPFLIVGSLGTTNTGSIDDFEAIHKLCEMYDMWFHIDGAFGGSILISDIYRNLAKGIQYSDSFSWDTHKWGMQVYSCSSLICRDKKKLIKTYAEHPEYLADIMEEEHTDGWDLGIEMSRPHRGLKLWFTLQAMGVLKLADVIDYSFYNCILCSKKLKDMLYWEIVSKPSCAAICFRYHPEGLTEEELDNLNMEISKRLIEDGYAYIVTTVIKNKRVLRMCFLNASTTDEDVYETLEYLDKFAKQVFIEMYREKMKH